jgi:HEAT repeat protein
MKLTPCPFCAKPIPARMNSCPYCHRHEKGAPIVMDSQVPASAAAELTVKQIEHELVNLSSDDPYTREQGILRLAQHGLRVTQALMTALSDHASPALPAIAKTLGMIADKRSIGALTQAVKQGHDSLRTAALWALAQFRDPDVLPILLSEAEHVHPVTQHYVANVLSNFRDPRVVPVLSRLALHGTPEVVYQAAYALAEWNVPQSISTLRRTARRHDPVQRAVALASLKRLGVRAPVRWESAWVWGLGVCVAAILTGGFFWFHK